MEPIEVIFETEVYNILALSLGPIVMEIINHNPTGQIFIILGQDEFILCLNDLSKCWYIVENKIPLQSKSSYDSMMFSAFVSYNFGFYVTINSKERGNINKMCI